MAEKSLFHTTSGVGDGTATGYTSDEIVDWLRETFISDPTTEGVIPATATYATPLLVTAGANGSHSATVAAGRAWVYGFPYWNSTPVTVTLDAEEANPRIDRIVLRASWAAQTVRITAIKGTAAASPTAPALTQTADTTWDIPLAQVRLNADGTIVVTDERVMWKSRKRRFLVQPSGYYHIENGTNDLSTNRIDGAGFPIPYDYTKALATFLVPDDYASGLTVKGLVYGWDGDGAGNAYCEMWVYYGAAGEGYNQHTAHVPASAVAITGGRINVALTATLSSATAGDIVSLDWHRDSTNELDTCTLGFIYFMGFLVEYTAAS